MKMYFPTVAEYEQLKADTVAEYEQLKADTVEDRKLVKHCFPCKIFRRINKLVRYYTLKKSEPIMIYVACYHVGYIDGIRAERARRKKGAQ